jgi:hypothetical protein
MANQTILINRAPVLTLWAATVAERVGFDEDEALSLGKALAGLTAQTKGRRLGIYKPHEHGAKKAREKQRGVAFWVELLGRPVPAKNTENGIRAVHGTKEIQPESAQRYLESKFGEHLGAVRGKMKKLAKAFSAEELAIKGYTLYELLRPNIPSGVKGWGEKGELDLRLLERLANR